MGYTARGIWAIFILLAAGASAGGAVVNPNNVPAMVRYQGLAAPLLGAIEPPSVGTGQLLYGPTGIPSYNYEFGELLAPTQNQSIDISARLKLDLGGSNEAPAGLIIAFTNQDMLYQNIFLSPQEVFLNLFDVNGAQPQRGQTALVDALQWHTYDLVIYQNLMTVSVDHKPVLAGRMFDFSSSGTSPVFNYVALGNLAIVPYSPSEFSDLSVTVSPVPEGCYAPAALVGIMVVMSLRPRRSAFSPYHS